MARPTVTIRINTRGLRGLTRDIAQQLRGSSRRGPFGDMWVQIGVRYLTFVRRRYVRESQGGGDWPPLARSTILGRRSRRQSSRRRKRRSAEQIAKTVASAKILRDTGTLLGALSVGNRGNRFDREKGGIIVGFSKRQRHEGEGRRGLSIGRLAEIHNMGQGRNPQRAILVRPDQATAAAINRLAQRAVNRSIAENRI